MRGFILTTKGDLQSKIDYTFRIYDQNDDNQISGEEIQQMATVRMSKAEENERKLDFNFQAVIRMLGGDENENDQAAHLIIHQFLKQLTGNGNGIIYKHDFMNTIMQNKELLAIISPFYGRCWFDERNSFIELFFQFVRLNIGIEHSSRTTIVVR